MSIESDRLDVEIQIDAGQRLQLLPQQPIVPFGDFGQSIVGDHEGSPLLWREMIETDGRNLEPAQAPAGEQPAVAGDDFQIGIDENQHVEVEGLDARGEGPGGRPHPRRPHLGFQPDVIATMGKAGSAGPKAVATEEDNSQSEESAGASTGEETSNTVGATEPAPSGAGATAGFAATARNSAAPNAKSAPVSSTPRQGTKIARVIELLRPGRDARGADRRHGLAVAYRTRGSAVRLTQTLDPRPRRDARQACSAWL